LNPFDPGIADSDDADRRTHHAMPRVIASLVYQSLRDTARGIVAAERNAEAKNSWHDGNAALVPTPPSLSAFNRSSLPRDHARAPLAASLPFRAYLARAPPLTA